jgi:L-threonylcarbamoyladenylate synthase
MTTTIPIADTPTPAQVEEIATILNAGGVVLLPTDTIYGLHARALDERAVGRIVDIKGRAETKPFVVLASTIEDFPDLGIDADPDLLQRLASIWPAPLTAILPLREPIAASRGMATLAVRIPALEWLRDLVKRTGPLVSTSANRSGEPPVDRPESLARELHESLDAIVDAGVRSGEPSAIVDLTSSEPRFLRDGERLFTQNLRKLLRKSL